MPAQGKEAKFIFKFHIEIVNLHMGLLERIKHGFSAKINYSQGASLHANSFRALLYKRPCVN